MGEGGDHSHKSWPNISQLLLWRRIGAVVMEFYAGEFSRAINYTSASIPRPAKNRYEIHMYYYKQHKPVIIIMIMFLFKLKLQRIFQKREKLHRDRNSIESTTLPLSWVGCWLLTASSASAASPPPARMGEKSI